MPEVTANGLKIYYRDVGEGFPIVFLHGFTGNTRNWALTVPSLRDRFRCLSIDHPGHGQSEKPADTTFYALPNMAASPTPPYARSASSNAISSVTRWVA